MATRDFASIHLLDFLKLLMRVAESHEKNRRKSIQHLANALATNLEQLTVDERKIVDEASGDPSSLLRLRMWLNVDYWSKGKLLRASTRCANSSQTKYKST